MSLFNHKDRSPTNSSNVVPLKGHTFIGNTFRSRPPRVEGASVLCGRINNRYAIFVPTEDMLA